MAIGYFATPDASFYRNMVIYQKPATSPTTATSTPIYRAPVAPVAPPRGVPVPTTVTTVAPISGVVTTTSTSGDSFVSGSGGGATTANAGSGSTGTSTTPTGTTATGTETSSGGGTGGGVDSRLLDLLGSAFQQQDLQQGYAPQSVSSDALSPNSGGGKTNPMAVVVLAIIVMVGVYFWTHRRKAA